jgi:hypothetical protein
LFFPKQIGALKLGIRIGYSSFVGLSADCDVGSVTNDQEACLRTVLQRPGRHLARGAESDPRPVAPRTDCSPPGAVFSRGEPDCTGLQTGVTGSYWLSVRAFVAEPNLLASWCPGYSIPQPCPVAEIPGFGAALL